MADDWSTTVTDWQGVDKNSVNGSNNLITSGAVDLLSNEIGLKIGSYTNSNSASIKKNGNRNLTIPVIAKAGQRIKVLVNTNPLFADGSECADVITNNASGENLGQINSGVTSLFTLPVDINAIHLYFTGTNMLSEDAVNITVSVSPIGTMEEDIEGLEEILKPTTIDNIIYKPYSCSWQQGTISGGQEADSDYRIRTSQFTVKTGQRLVVTNHDSKYKFMVLSLQNGSWVSVSAYITTTSWDSGVRTSEITYRILVAGVSEMIITPDVGAKIISLIDDQNPIMYEQEIINNNLSSTNDLILENGGINTSTGEDVSVTSRVRTKNYIYNKTLISAAEGCKVYAVLYYNSSTHAFEEAQLIKLPSCVVYKEGCIARVTFSADNETDNISPEKIQASCDLNYLETEINTNNTLFGVEEGGINAGTGLDAETNLRLRTIGYNYGFRRIKLPKGYQIYVIYFYDKALNNFVNYQGIYANEAVVGSDTYKWRISIAKQPESTITIDEFRGAYGNPMYDLLSHMYSEEEPLVQFTYEHKLKDVSAYLTPFDFTSLSTVMEQVYTQFDALVSAHSSYISRVDALDYAATRMQQDYGVEYYPIYARLGGVAQGGYLATPSYKTYMYCLSENNTYIGNGTYCKKRKIFIVGATHGIEIGGSVNAYILAKELCESTDPNIMKLRAAYDIYIVPCLNGYGIYHQTRYNADGIDINRNYPVPNWQKAYEPGNPQYSGETPGSIFESQLVMSVFKTLKPDIAIDHHNYWASETMAILYTEVADKDHARICYQSLIDMASTFINELPAYYGTSSQLFMNYDTNAAPYKVGPLNGNFGQTFRWFACNGAHVALTLEIGANIPCLNGVAVTTNENFSNDAMAVAEYTLTNQLYRFCEWDMKKAKRKLQGINYNIT